MARRVRTPHASPPDGSAAAASAEQLATPWLTARGWQPHPFQREVWALAERGQSGLLSVPTGAGKTMAALYGLLARAAAEPAAGLRILYISPLRAVVNDVAKAMAEAVQASGLPLEVAVRTGDVSAAEKARQRRRLPGLLATTPESLSILLARPDFGTLAAHVVGVIIDEWHELMGTKRGVQVELALARLRRVAPGLATWALSATLANLDEAAQVAVGMGTTPAVIAPKLPRPLAIETLLHKSVEVLPWTGHYGLQMAGPLVEHLRSHGPTLIFTNTRAQAEQWFQALIAAEPERAERTAVHHGSLDRTERERVEQGLSEGRLDRVVATSSLDLGVDFAPVEHVVQIGSPKGLARLLQRAGRSGHRAFAAASLALVPTHASDLLVFAAAREALARGEIEARRPLRLLDDVLAQHLVTRALGGGFKTGEIAAELRSTFAYRDLSDAALASALEFVERGGQTLRAYERYHRVLCIDGVWQVADERIARLHRMNIGTITADSDLAVRFQNGARIGRVEERFIARLAPGDVFTLGGRELEIVRIRAGEVDVKLATGRSDVVPRWMGGRMPLSSTLGHAVRRILAAPDTATHAPIEIAALAPYLAAQRKRSHLPKEGEILVELLADRDADLAFLYPFEGRLAHEGLAALLAHRLTAQTPLSLSTAIDDHGILLAAAGRFDFASALNTTLFDDTHLERDVLASLATTELARRRFRDIARIAGLVVQAHPDGPRGLRELQTSSTLLFEVFERYDPEHPLLVQARREVLEQELELTRLRGALQRLKLGPVRTAVLSRPSPLGFPLLVERTLARVSSEDVATRVERMLAAWDQQPSGSTSPVRP